MRARTLSLQVILPAAAAIAFLAVFSPVREATAFQQFGASQGSGETCAFSIQMKKPAFRMRYMEKVAKYQDGAAAAPRLATIDEMYGNVQEVSLFTDEGGSSSAEAFNNAIGVDPLSLDCLSCHDGSGASNVTINLRNDPYKRFRNAQNAKDHPIGMEYGNYVATPGNDYKPIFGRSNMVLVNGKVGCLTCHDPQNSEKGHLVMSDRNSALCLSCHSK
ncbi:MAG TPA: hypothetical protein DCZ75_15375 [Geobacter sp.]|nr:hypothetical protein [Geobacter sp.]